MSRMTKFSRMALGCIVVATLLGPALTDARADASAYPVSAEELEAASESTPLWTWHLSNCDKRFTVMWYCPDQGQYPAARHYFVVRDRNGNITDLFTSTRVLAAHAYDLPAIVDSTTGATYYRVGVLYVNSGTYGNGLYAVSEEGELTELIWADQYWPEWGPHFIDVNDDRLYEVVIPSSYLVSQFVGKWHLSGVIQVLGENIPLEDYEESIILRGGSLVIKLDLTSCEYARWQVVEPLISVVPNEWHLISGEGALQLE
jgi:hypothetical protein